jgi:fatty acid desaturase
VAVDPLARRIRKLAELSVMKASGYACLAVVMAMSGMAFAPSLAFRWGAIMMLVLGVVLELVGRRYHRIRRITETEVWNMLPAQDRPDKERARTLIVAAMRAELHQKALWAGMVALGLLAASILFRAAGYQ